MLNDFFEQTTIDKMSRAMKVLGPIIGAVLVYYFGMMAIEQFRGDAAALSRAVDDDASLPMAQAVARATDISVKATNVAIAAATALTEATPEPDIVAAAPVEEAAVPAPEEVVAVFNKNTCGSCHVIPGIPNAIGQIGPDLSNIGVDGATRKEGMSAVDYIHESIVNPEAYIVPECPTGACLSGVMLPSFADAWTEDELNIAVDYLASLKTE